MTPKTMWAPAALLAAALVFAHASMVVIYLISRQIHNAINEAPLDMKYMHAATYSGHPVCCAVGVANVGIMEREGLVERAAAIGAWFQAQLHAQLGSLPKVGQVRGLGMMAAVEMVDPDATGSAYYENAAAMTGRIVARCAQNGVLPRRLNNTIVMAPPLISTEQQLSRLIQVLDGANDSAIGGQ